MNAIILIVPVGNIEPEVLERICSAVQETFHRGCHIGNGEPIPNEAFNPSRGQYSADVILQHLQPNGAERVLGIADLDLYVPQLNFVFGLADPLKKRAVIALPRLRPKFYGQPANKELFLERAVIEAVHELGHTYGLNHCNDRRCVMTFSNSLADTDYKRQSFCPKCQNKLSSGVLDE